MFYFFQNKKTSYSLSQPLPFFLSNSCKHSFSSNSHGALLIPRRALHSKSVSCLTFDPLLGIKSQNQRFPSKEIAKGTAVALGQNKRGQQGFFSSLLSYKAPNIALKSNNKSKEYNQTENKSLLFKDKKRKKNYTSYSKLSEIKLITIGIASPLRILQWAEKTLPNGKIYGEVLNANTLHHKTFKPQKGGLFCERIFGPLKDFECACGKVDKSVKKLAVTSSSFKTTDKPSPGFNMSQPNASSQTLLFPKNRLAKEEASIQEQTQQEFSSRKYCPDCDVEYTWSVIRRYQLGYIKLSSPVTHIWFLKGTPSYLSLLLDMKKRHLQFVTYCSETLTIEKSSLPFYNNNDSFLDTLSSFKSSPLTPQETLASSYQLDSTLARPKAGSGILNETFNGKAFDSSGELDKKSVNVGIKQEEGTLGNVKIKKLKKPIPKKGWSLYTLKNKNKGITIKQGAMILSTFLLSSYFNKNSKKYNYNVFLPLTFKSSNLLREHLQKHTSSQEENLLSYQGPQYQSFNENEVAHKVGNLVVHEVNNHALADSKKSMRVIQPQDSALTHTAFITLCKSGEASLLLKAKKNKECQKQEYNLKLNLPSILTTKVGKTLNAQEEKFPYLSYQDFLDTQTSFEGNFFTLDSPTLGCLPSFQPANNQQRAKAVLAPVAKINRITLKRFANACTSIQQSNKGEKNKKDFSKIFSFAKKLPLDLYILFSIERFLHKSAVRLSIKKAWETLYKQAFIKTTQKAKLFLKNFLHKNNLNMLSYLVLSKKVSFSPLVSALESLPLAQGKLLSYAGNESASARLHTSCVTKMLTTSLKSIQKLKIKYNLHVLKSLYSLKQPIFSLNHTTLFLKQNSFVDLENRISTQIERFLIKNTDYIQYSLTDSFLKSLIVDQLINIYNPKSLYLNKSFSFVTNKEEEREKLKGLLLSFKNFSSLTSLNFDKILSSNVLEEAKIRVKEEQFLKKEVRKNEINNEYKKKRKKIYNNIYTLSHRERWDNDKEWQFFSLYSFGVKDYTDFPIFTYKNRLSSVLQSIDFSYFQSETKKSSFDSYKNSLNSSNTLPYIQQKESEQQEQAVLYSAKGKTMRTLTVPRGGLEVRQSSSFFSGAGIVQQLLNELDFYEIKKLDKQNRLLLYQINKDIFKQKKKIQTSVYNKKLQTELKEMCKKRDLLIRRTKLVRKIFRKNNSPSSMILTIIPVLPPDLRPIVKMGNQIAASDLNRLYQRVIYRNERLKKFLKDPATSQSYEMKYAQRLLQEAVDNLMQNGKSGPNSEKDGRGRALKSLSDILKGKQGRFRQFLLGKRVDYSGRSVIVVGPKLKLYECGLPVEMAKELYLPFLLKRILNKNYAKTVVGAKTLIQKNPSLANELLREIMQVSPLLLNRAPTLHRLGIQAFIPKLIEGRAILLHPLVCSAFNADFDGDQMAVHVPITIEARAEAWKMMLSRNNIFSPATGDPLAIPSQDMVLGCYYLTTFSNKNINKSKNLLGSGLYFKNLNDVIKLYDQQLLDIHALVWVKYGTSYLSSLSRETRETAFGTAFPYNNKNNFVPSLQIQESKNESYVENAEEKLRANKKALITKETIDFAKAKVMPTAVAPAPFSKEKGSPTGQAELFQEPIALQKLELIENENEQEDLFEIRISSFGQWQEITSSSHKLYDVNHNLISQYMCTTPGRILFNLLIQKTINKE